MNIKNLRFLNNRGGIDPTAWMIGIAGFVVTYFVWVFASPLIKELVNFGTGLNLSNIALSQFVFIQMLFDYAMVINAGIWFIFILLSSVRSEVEEREYPFGY